MFLEEHLKGDFAADPGTVGDWDRGVGRQSVFPVERVESSGDLDSERSDVGVVDLVRSAEPGRLQDLRRGRSLLEEFA